MADACDSRYAMSTRITAAQHPAGPLASLEKLVTFGQMLKTLAGLGIALVAGGLAVYQHFAKTSELDALKCSVVDQNIMNNEMVKAAGDIRGGMLLLQRGLDKPGADGSFKELTGQLSQTISGVEGALARIEEVKKRLEAQSITGVRKC
jgi:hypothetical protein